MAGTFMGEVGARYTEPAVWLAGTVMGEVWSETFHGSSNAVSGWHGYGPARVPATFYGASNTVVGWHSYGRGRGPVASHGTSNTVVGWHGSGRGRGRQYYGWLVRLWRGQGPVHITEPAMLRLAGTVMGEVGARNKKPVNCVAGWHGFGRGQGPSPNNQSVPATYARYYCLIAIHTLYAVCQLVTHGFWRCWIP